MMTSPRRRPLLPLLCSFAALVACAGNDAGTTSGGDTSDTGSDPVTAGPTGATGPTTGPTSAPDPTTGDATATTDADTGDTDPTTGDPGGDEVTEYDVEPGILASAPKPGFCEPELYTKDVDGVTEYWLRDVVQGYADPRPRAFYVDFGFVGTTLDYGPILRGGVYSVRCLRFAGDLWWSEEGTLESHVVWFRVPGPMMEAGEVQVPASFQVADNFIVDQTTLLPPFAAIAGKINLVYQWYVEDTLEEIYSRGATHVSAQGNPGEADPSRLGLTSAVDFDAPWQLDLGVDGPIDNLDNLGEFGFRNMTDAQMDEAIAQQPDVGMYFFDLEKTPWSGDPDVYWSIPIEDATLPRYYRMFQRFHEVAPQRLLADYYRPLVWNKGFTSLDDGNPTPFYPKYPAQLADPETAVQGAYRKFDKDGQTVSLRDVTDIYIIDVYPARGHGPFDLQPDKADRSWASYQLYSMIYDTMLTRKVVPPSTKVLWFGWSQSDNDVPTRLYIDLPTGRASYWVRHPLPAAWAETVEMLGYIVGDGFHWWTEQVRRGDDPNKLGTGDGDPQWEPKEPGTPPPWMWSDNPNGDGAYPRMHEYALSYGKLGQYRAKQVEDRLGSWSFAAYTLDGGPGSVPSGDMTILELAEGRLPIVLLLGEPGARAVFAVHPFGDYRRRYTLEVDVDGAPTLVTISGKWPTLVRR